MPSPSKRPRLGTADIPSTPPLSAPRSASTSVSIDSLAAALPEPSRQSALRFFTTLATLPGKYAFDEEDDDIVDFETDSIIPGKRGLLTRSKSEWKFGCFAPPRVAEDGEVESGTAGENETDPLAAEEDEDELDLIRPKSPSKSPMKDASRANSVHLPEPSALHLPPLDPVNNAQDAEDLQEFLQEEALLNRRLHESDPDTQTEDDNNEDDDYVETFEDTEVPVPDEEEESQAALDDDEDEESDDMDGYDAGEGSIVRNPDGSIRSMPTPTTRSPSRARSRSISVKPIQQSYSHSPLQQPIFSRPPSKPPTERHQSISRSRAPSTSLTDFTPLGQDYSPPSSPLKDIRIRPRSRPSMPERRPSSSSVSDVFARPSTPPSQRKFARVVRPPSPEVLPPPPTPPPKRPVKLSTSKSYPLPSGSSERSPMRSGSLSPSTRVLRSAASAEELNNVSRSAVSRNTRSHKGKEVERSAATPTSSSPKGRSQSKSSSLSKKPSHLPPIQVRSSSRDSAQISLQRGKKRKRSLSMSVPDDSPHRDHRGRDRGHTSEVEDTFQYPFRSRSHSPVAHESHHSLSEKPNQFQLLSPRKALADVTPSPSRSHSRVRGDANQLRRKEDSDEQRSHQRLSRPPPAYRVEHDGYSTRHQTSDASTTYTRQPYFPPPQPFPSSPPQNQLQTRGHHPEAVFTQAMQAMQAMSAMMMQYTNVVQPNQRQGQPYPHHQQPPRAGPSNEYVPASGTEQWRQAITAPYREQNEWSKDQIPSTSSSSPARYPPPSSSPSTPGYSYEEPESDFGQSGVFSDREQRRRREPGSSPLKQPALGDYRNSPPRLPSALVSRPSSLSRSRHNSRSGSRVKKRVSFELHSIEQIINISSDGGETEQEEHGDYRHGGDMNEEDDEDEREDERQIVSRGATPGPSDRPVTRQPSRTRRGTPAPTRRRASSPQEHYSRRQRSSQQLR